MSDTYGREERRITAALGLIYERNGWSSEEKLDLVLEEVCKTGKTPHPKDMHKIDSLYGEKDTGLQIYSRTSKPQKTDTKISDIMRGCTNGFPGKK